MANEVLRTKLNAIKQSKFYSTMCDEYTDVANKERLLFCHRWIDENLCAREDFLGYYELPNIKSDTIVAVIRDCLIRVELPIQNLRGQTYDGASNMMGEKEWSSTANIERSTESPSNSLSWSFIKLSYQRCKQTL